MTAQSEAVYPRLETKSTTLLSPRFAMESMRLDTAEDIGRAITKEIGRPSSRGKPANLSSLDENTVTFPIALAQSRHQDRRKLRFYTDDLMTVSPDDTMSLE